MNRDFIRRWLPFSVATVTALAIWALSAAHGYGWAMIWLPAVVAGAAWPRQRSRSGSERCDGETTRA